MYNPVRDDRHDRCEGTDGNQTGLPAIMEVFILRIQFCIHCSCNIPQTTEIFFTLLPLFHRNISPLLSNLSTMALTKTSILIKTRSQVRTESNARTIAPAPVAVVPTTDPSTTNPVAVAAATGRTTDTLKDPPVAVRTGMKTAPRDRAFDSDSDDDANKKPAAKQGTS